MKMRNGIFLTIFALVMRMSMGMESGTTIPLPNAQPTALWARGYSVIPTPRKVELGEGEISFDQDWRLEVKGVSSDDIAADFLKSDLETFHRITLSGSAGRILHLEVSSGAVKTGAKPALDEQAYRLTIQSSQVSIIGNAPAGLFYGVQTFLQLLKPKHGIAFLPECIITDWPELQLLSLIHI